MGKKLMAGYAVRMQSFVEHLISSRVSNLSLQQMSLRPKMGGGLGLRMDSTYHSAAYVASLSQSMYWMDGQIAS